MVLYRNLGWRYLAFESQALLQIQHLESRNLGTNRSESRSLNSGLIVLYCLWHNCAVLMCTFKPTPQKIVLSNCGHQAGLIGAAFYAKRQAKI